MFTKSQLLIFITLFSLTFTLFSSSTILSKYVSFETEVEAKNNENFFKKHVLKPNALQMKDSEPLLSQLEKSEPKWPIFLTFDDGPTKFTLNILDILAQYGIKSTFFMLNGNINNHPDIVKAIAEHGHSLGCHGVTHRVERFYKTATSPRDEMDVCRQSISEITGTEIELIRVPFGSFPNLTKAQKIELDKVNYIMWDWNVDSMDWSLNSSHSIIETVLKQVEIKKSEGKVPVILFHDKVATVEALPKIIESLREMGFDFQPITANDPPLQFTQKK